MGRKASGKAAGGGGEGAVIEVEGDVGGDDARDNIVGVLEHHGDDVVATADLALEGR